jgi:16S rRNA (guanine527-N7)-methyltransferase
MMNSESESGSAERVRIGLRLNESLATSGLKELNAAEGESFATYLELLLRWNARMNLTAIRDEAGILSRHFVESIACAQALPTGIATLLDFGSGAGFPGIPIALCRPEMVVTLAESQGKKAAFLREAVRVLGLSSAIHAGRAETLPLRFDCVTLRAVDRMEEAVELGGRMVRPGGWLAPMTSSIEFERVKVAAGSGFSWSEPIALPGSEKTFLALARRLNPTV